MDLVGEDEEVAVLIDLQLARDDHVGQVVDAVEALDAPLRQVSIVVKLHGRGGTRNEVSRTWRS